MTQYKFKINGKEYEVAVNGIEGQNASVTVNGIDYSVELENAPAVGGVPSETAATLGTLRGGTTNKVSGGVERSEPVSEGSSSTAPKAVGAGKKITSPLPGVIIDVCVKEGEAVKKGQKIAVIEAMKMENDILAESDGTVTAIYVSKSDSVLEGADIASIA